MTTLPVSLTAQQLITGWLINNERGKVCNEESVLILSYFLRTSLDNVNEIMNETGNVRIKVILRRVRVTIIVVEKQ